MLIYILQEHLHQFTLLLVIIHQKCEEILVLLIPNNQCVLYGVKIGEAEIFQRKNLFGAYPSQSRKTQNSA